MCRYTTRPCAQIEFALGRNDTLAAYPGCADYFNSKSPDLPVVVTVDFSSDNAMELSAALAIPFGTAGWLALLLHTIAIEVYVSAAMMLGRDEYNADILMFAASTHAERIEQTPSGLV